MNGELKTSEHNNEVRDESECDEDVHQYVPRFINCECGKLFQTFGLSDKKCFDCAFIIVECSSCDKTFNKFYLSPQDKCYDCKYPKIKCSVCSKTYRVQMQDGKCTTC